ncbi:MAG: hypothetical protein HYU86_08800 [Chloroflexi bacterium]|nr:hypothetical protein [Chloroflexota bacterium]
MADLNTTGNKLSVWHVEDDKSNLNQVIVALASNFDYSSNVDYVLFDKNLLSRASIAMEHSKGETLLKEADSWHRDLIQLTAQKVVELAKLAMQNGEKKRVSEEEVISLVRKAVETGAIDSGNLKKGLRRKIGLNIVNVSDTHCCR